MDQQQPSGSYYHGSLEGSAPLPRAPKKKQSTAAKLSFPPLRIRSNSTESTRGAFVVSENNDIPPNAIFLGTHRGSSRNLLSSTTHLDQNPSLSVSDHYPSLGSSTSNVNYSGEETNIASKSLPQSYQRNHYEQAFDSFQQKDRPNMSNGLEYEDMPECIDNKGQLMKRSSFLSNLVDSLYSSVHDFYYSSPENVGPMIRFLRSLFYDPTNPEFTSLQQSSWAVILGVFFGVTTALWQKLIESSCDFIWNDVPEKLLQWGLFTDLNGPFPLPHFCWICTSFFGGFLGWISVSLPVSIPGQNEWIEGIHRQGILDPSSFWYIFLISTGGMMSGLSLGPELPLVLLSGMVGSFIAVRMHQSVLSARVMVLTAGGAAVGGFFGFPMAGALFVLELPHRELTIHVIVVCYPLDLWSLKAFFFLFHVFYRQKGMGMQYFEALSPANVSSIIAVLFNRIVTGNDVKGYYLYPFLATSLKSHVFYIAIVYGLIGALVGTVYCKTIMFLKTWVHDWFHHSHTSSKKPLANGDTALKGECLPLVGDNDIAPPENTKFSLKDFFLGGLDNVLGFSIKHEQTRAAVVGVLAGFFVGVIGMFLPHNLFWGEAQLQTLIDGGRSPLPILGKAGEPTEALLAWSYCLVDPSDAEATLNGPGLLCNFSMFVSKYICIGLSVGTGIVGGQFWGPLYLGAVASNFFVDLMKLVHKYSGIGSIFFEHPCIAILCIMGSAHTVVFRAHTAIMLVLTLTVSAFKDEGTNFFAAGDYAAIFPLLVVSCFVSLMVTRAVVFYKQQRCRGDIIAAPEVLCEPGKVGKPIMHVPMVAYDEDDLGSLFGDSGVSVSSFLYPDEHLDLHIKKADVEKPRSVFAHKDSFRGALTKSSSDDVASLSAPSSDSKPNTFHAKIDELLKDSDRKTIYKGSHRRAASGSDALLSYLKFEGETGTRGRASSFDQQEVSGTKESKGSEIKKTSRHQRTLTPTQGILMRIESKGNIEDFQPSLMDQGRIRASSTRQPILPKPMPANRRAAELSPRDTNEIPLAVSQDDLEAVFQSLAQL